MHARYMLLCTHARMKCSKNLHACSNKHKDHFIFSWPLSNMAPSMILWRGLKRVFFPPTVRLYGGGHHCGDPPQTIAVGSHLRQSPRKKLWGVTSGSPPTAIVSGDSPQRVLSAMEHVVWKSLKSILHAPVVTWPLERGIWILDISYHTLHCLPGMWYESFEVCDMEYKVV